MEESQLAELMNLFETLAGKLGVPTGYLLDLTKETDWNVIIQSHALIETALNEGIVKKLGFPELTDNISNLPTSETKAGKCAFAVSLGIISKEEAKNIQRLSEIRNRLVHNAKNLRFSLSDWWQRMDEGERDAWHKRLNPLTNGKSQVVDSKGNLKKGQPAFGIIKLSLKILITILLRKYPGRQDMES